MDLVRLSGLVSCLPSRGLDDGPGLILRVIPYCLKKSFCSTWVLCREKKKARFLKKIFTPKLFLITIATLIGDWHGMEIGTPFA